MSGLNRDRWNAPGRGRKFLRVEALKARQSTARRRRSDDLGVLPSLGTATTVRSRSFGSVAATPALFGCRIWPQNAFMTWRPRRCRSLFRDSSRRRSRSSGWRRTGTPRRFQRLHARKLYFAVLACAENDALRMSLANNGQSGFSLYLSLMNAILPFVPVVRSAPVTAAIAPGSTSRQVGWYEIHTGLRQFRCFISAPDDLFRRPRTSAFAPAAEERPRDLAGG